MILDLKGASERASRTNRNTGVTIPPLRGGGDKGSTVKLDGPVALRLTLLGGFRVERGSVVADSAWQQRRSAKMLVKLIALHPGHALHREQIMEMLWPDADFGSTVNSFGKALHAARRALEPDMPARGTSLYLRLVDDVLMLVTENVWIDADHFQSLAETALRRGDVASYERALATYTGDLLPEDAYESWTQPRRDTLAELRFRLLLGVAEALERRGDREAAIERLNQILQVDAAREDVHRDLMRLHAESGRRRAALRQYELCCEALMQELDAQPESATVALYQALLADRFDEAPAIELVSVSEPEKRSVPAAIRTLPATPLFGRARERDLLLEDFRAAEAGSGRTVLASGEAGLGKTRLVAETAREAADSGAIVLWGGSCEQFGALPYGPFAHALETYVATCDVTEQQALASRYPELLGLLPSLSSRAEDQHWGPSQEPAQGRLFGAIVRILSDLARTGVVVLALDDLHAASRESLQLLQHLSQLAPHRRWLILGTYREEALPLGSELPSVLVSGTRLGYCRHLYLQRFTRHDCDELVHAVLQTALPSPALLERVYELSLGNPLFALELLGAMQGRGELVLARGYWHLTSSAATSVPRQVARLVNLRFEQMNERAQRVLSLLAVAGFEFSFEELCLAAYEVVDSELSDADLLDILDAALQMNILEEHGDGYVFAHPLFRAALYGNLSRGRLARMHGAVARAIEAYRPDESELLTYHYSRCSRQERPSTRSVRTPRDARKKDTNGSDSDPLEQLMQQVNLGTEDGTRRARHQLQALLEDTARGAASRELVEEGRAV